MRAARESGEEYLLDRMLLRRKSTGELVKRQYTEMAFPYYWHYDVLRVLDYMRRAGRQPDERMHEAIEIVRSTRDEAGRWPLDHTYPGRVFFHLEDPGEPSRWNTLRAMRVLAWADGSES